MLPNSWSSQTCGFYLVAINLKIDFLPLEEGPKFMAIKSAVIRNLSTKTRKVGGNSVLRHNCKNNYVFVTFLCLFVFLKYFYKNISTSKMASKPILVAIFD